MKPRWIALCAILIAASALAAETHDTLAGKPDLDVLDADRQLPRTRVVPTLESKHEKGANLMYCATLQLAWNELVEMLDSPIKLDGDPSAAKSLNKKDFTREMLDKQSYYVFCGMGADAPARMRAELQEHFAGAASPKLIPSDNLGLNEFVAYAYLFKNLEFSIPFYPYPSALEFDSARVTSFGVPARGRDRAAQLSNVVVHDHVSDDDFVFELKSKTPDRLIVAKLTPAGSLQKTIEDVLGRLNRTKRTTLEYDEMLQVPGFNFELVKQFGELAPRKLYHKNWPVPGELKEVAQLIRFKLNERGAILKSEAKKRGSVGESSIDDDGAPPPPPRLFICDKPFLILMLRPDQKKPYFAMWVENPELMAKFTAPTKEKTDSRPAPLGRGGIPFSGANVDD